MKKIKEGHIDYKELHQSMQNELERTSQYYGSEDEEPGHTSQAQASHGQLNLFERVEADLADAKDCNHPKVKGPSFYKRLHRRQGRLNRMLIRALTRILDHIKSRDKESWDVMRTLDDFGDTLQNLDRRLQQIEKNMAGAEPNRSADKGASKP